MDMLKLALKNNANKKTRFAKKLSIKMPPECVRKLNGNCR